MRGVGSGSGPTRHVTDHTDHATDLLRARTALIAPPPGARRLGAADLRAALVDLHDLWLARRAAALGIGRGSALVAFGSLGRREPAPYSVPDLLLVHDGTRPGIQRIAAGLGVDPVVRTVGEAVEAALGDLPTALGLLEVRPVAGDPDLAERLAATARRAWRAGAPGRLPALAALAASRWDRAGDVAHRLAPDLRDGRGGLRDLALLDALAEAGMADPPAAAVRAARRVLLDLRTDAHRRAGRARDVLRTEEVRDDPAAHHELLRALATAARAVVHATDAALRRSAGPPRTRTPGRPPGDGVVEHGGELTVTRQARVARDPVLVLRLASAAAHTGLPMSSSALRRLADAAPELRTPWPDAARRALLALLGAGDGLVGVVAALDRVGLWGRLLPEWGAVRDLPPRDPRHLWTVGRHLLEVTRHAAAAPPAARPDLLLFGALVHDLGCGRAGDPREVGAAVAARFGRRPGLPPADVATATAAVRHQDLLLRTARRSDPEDPATVRRVLATLDGDPVLLELLRALTEADLRGTAPGMWTPWRARLVDELVERCRRAGAVAPR